MLRSEVLSVSNTVPCAKDCGLMIKKKIIAVKYFGILTSLLKNLPN
jgi:hypothetical protein